MPQLFSIVGGFRLREIRQLQPLPNREFGFRIFDIARDSVDELFETVRAFHVEEPAVVAIGVDVDGGVLPQLVGMRFDPLGRPQQHRLFAVPCAIDDGPPRFPALLEQ